jgi:hypothetical protein
VAGFLGSHTPEQFFGASAGRGAVLPCHSQIDYGDPDWRRAQFEDADFCAGNLIFYRNWKMPGHPELADVVRAVSMSPHVFMNPAEFFAHHAPGAVGGADALH